MKSSKNGGHCCVDTESSPYTMRESGVSGIDLGLRAGDYKAGRVGGWDCPSKLRWAAVS